MMKILIKNEAKQLWNSLRTQKKSHLVSYLAAMIGLLFFLGVLTQAAWAMSSSVTEPVFAGILTYGCLLIVGMIILMGVPQVFKDMYSTTDLEQLFTLPIKTKYIFRSEEHTSELQSRGHIVCRLLLEKKKILQLTIIL